MGINTFCENGKVISQGVVLYLHDVSTSLFFLRPCFIWQSCIPGAAHPKPQYASSLTPLSAQVVPSSNPNEALPIMSSSLEDMGLSLPFLNLYADKMHVSRCQTMYGRRNVAYFGAQDLAEGRDEKLLPLRCLFRAVAGDASRSDACCRCAGCIVLRLMPVTVMVSVAMAAAALFMAVIMITLSCTRSTKPLQQAQIRSFACAVTITARQEIFTGDTQDPE